MKSYAIALFCLLSAAQAATINVPTCSQDDFEHAYYVQSHPGDVIVLPAGTATWGNRSRNNNGIIYITTNVTVVGQGDNTVITLDDTGPTYGSGGVIALWSASTFKHFKIIASGVSPVTAFHVQPYQTFNGGFRITDLTYQGGTGDGYFCYISTDIVTGLIDGNRVNANHGSDELIFIRGPQNAWTTADTMGTANNIFIESNTFTGPGYVCDANSNARVVVRFNTITGNMKIDGHGYASNSNPARGVRHMEVYDNTFTFATGAGQRAIEIRGGSGMIFDNASQNSASNAFALLLNDYGALNNVWGNFNFTFQTPTNYPIFDQVGVGPDPKTAHSLPMYLWNNTAQGGTDWAVGGDAIPQAAIDLYRTQTNNPAATFTMADLIQADRDYFKQTVGGNFDGSSGVGRGTRAQMNAITPTKVGVAYWVTDEGSWNANLPANTSGQLYRWSGTSWQLWYTPYTYPNPLRAPRAPSNLQLGP